MPHREGSGCQATECRPAGGPSSTTASVALRASQMRMMCWSRTAAPPQTYSPSRDCSAQLQALLLTGSRRSCTCPSSGGALASRDASSEALPLFAACTCATNGLSAVLHQHEAMTRQY